MQFNQKLNYFFFILIACFWGGSFVAIKFAIESYPPVFGAMLRIAIAEFSLIIYFFLTRENLKVPFDLRWRMWIIGLFAQAFPFALLFWGEKYISSGLAGILNGTIPIWAFIFGVTLFGQKDLITPKKISGLCLGFLGIGIIFWPLIRFNHSNAEVHGTIAVILMAASYGFGAILNQRLFAKTPHLRVQANIYHQLWASLTFLLIVSYCFEPWLSFTAFTLAHKAFLASIYTGFFSTALALLLYYHLIKEWGAVRAAATTYVAPIMALVWDLVFFGNHPTWAELAGIITILCGVILIQFSPSNKLCCENVEKNNPATPVKIS